MIRADVFNLVYSRVKMAKLSDRQKVNLRAKWDTGQYTKKQLAKAYKISDVMVGKIVGKEAPKNADIVEASVIVEKAKKFDKSSAEVSAIDQAVKYRLEVEFSEDQNKIKIFDTTSKILDGVANLIAGGKAQKVVTEGMGDGMSRAEVKEYDLQPADYKNAMDTVDKASITLGVNKRHAPKSEITNNNTNGQQTNITAPEIEGYSVEVITEEEIEEAKNAVYED